MKYSLGVRAIIAAILCSVFVSVYILSPIAEALNTHSIDIEKDSSQFLSITDASQTGLDITGDLTMEAWIKLESQPATSEQYTIAGKYDSAAGERSYQFGYRNNGGTKQLFINVTSNGSNTTTGTVNYTLSSSTWYHVAVTLSGGTATFYVDGTSAGTASGLNSSIYSGAGAFTIGASANSFPTVEAVFDGLIDDVRIWNVVRTATEISDNRDTELNGNETGLVGYWKLNNSLADSTSNGNTLTNNNTALFSTDTHAPSFTEDLSNRKSTNESVTSSTAVQNDDQLKLSLAANKTYIIDGVIFASSTSATPDLKIAFTGQTGVNIRIGYTDDIDNMVLTSGQESNTIALQANSPRAIHIAGTVVTSSTSGDLQLKWAQFTSSSNATTVMAGSYLRAQEI